MMPVTRKPDQRTGRRVTVAHLITGLEVGGAERMLSRLVTRMDRDRFNSVVISMTSAGTMGPVLAAQGIPLELLGFRRGMVDPLGIARLGRILRAWRPQILQTWLYHADLLGVAARRLGYAPSLLWNIRCSETVGARLVRLACRRLSAAPDAVVVNSRAGQRFHQRLGYCARRWEYIPNGFDTQVLRPDADARSRLRAEFAIAERAIAIGIAARYHPMKDHATFLAAAASLARRHEDVVFLLVGTGMTASNRALTEAIGAYGLAGRVRLLGERHDMGRVYPGFDIASLSSAFGEGFPNVLAEAMSCAVPCVATDSGDSAEIIGDAGISVPCRDPGALAAAWARIAELPSEERLALGCQARERIARNYDLDAIIGRYERLYEEIAERTRRVQPLTGYAVSAG
jgi:glycosyltransferase involved in cell wall biosynthesis